MMNYRGRAAFELHLTLLLLRRGGWEAQRGSECLIQLHDALGLDLVSGPASSERLRRGGAQQTGFDQGAQVVVRGGRCDAQRVGNLTAGVRPVLHQVPQDRDTYLVSECVDGGLRSCIVRETNQTGHADILPARVRFDGCASAKLIT